MRYKQKIQMRAYNDVQNVEQILNPGNCPERKCEIFQNFKKNCPFYI